MKAAAGTTKAKSDIANASREHRETSIGALAGSGDDPLRNLLLEHQRHRGRPERTDQPLHQQRRADVVGQVGGDRSAAGADPIAPRPRARRRGRCGRRPGHPSPRRSSRGRKRGSVSIASTTAPISSRARVRPPGPGPTSSSEAPGAGSAILAMRRQRLRSSRKCWPRRFRASMPAAASRPAGASGSARSSRPRGVRRSRPPDAARRSGCPDERCPSRRYPGRRHDLAMSARSAVRG